MDLARTLEAMDRPGFQRSTETYASVLRSCGNARDLAAGRRVHLSINRSPHRRSVFLCNLLIQMYGKCGCVEDAREVFDDCSQLNVYSWNLMMTAYAQNGHMVIAREMFEVMPRRDVVSWNVMITGYVNSGEVEEARRIFERMTSRNAVSWTAMITAYTRNGDIEEAKSLFDRMPERDVTAWNAILAGYVTAGRLEDATRTFDSMRNKDAFTWTTMVAAYAHGGHIGEAKRTFDLMPHKDIPACNAMIQGFSQAGMLEEARELFSSLSKPDQVSWSAIVSAYAEKGHLEEAKDLYKKMPVWNIVTCTAMIVALSQHGDIQQARGLFDRMPKRDAVAWNAMLTGYCQRQRWHEAVFLFRSMDQEGFKVDSNTLSLVFNACANLPSLQLGKALHSAIEGVGGLPADVVVGTSMIDMYGKCGQPELAWSVFGVIQEKNMVTWSAMIAAYAHNGHPVRALELLDAMNLEGVTPGDIVFVNVLFACSHAGLLERGLDLFASMAADYNVEAKPEHFPCVVDLLGRAGWLIHAQELAETIPGASKSWSTLLASCKLHQDEKRAEKVAGIVTRLDPSLPSSYVIMSSIERNILRV